MIVLQVGGPMIEMAICNDTEEKTLQLNDTGDLELDGKMPRAALPPGYINGAKLEYASASKVSVGETDKKSFVRDVSNVFDIRYTGKVDADITLSGAGGLDTGSEASSTWYAIHLIADTTGVKDVDGMFSLSDASPTLPNGYDVFRCVGWVRNDSSSNFLKFMQAHDGNDRYIYYDDADSKLAALSGGTATTFTSVNLASFVPTNAQRVVLNLRFENDAASDALSLRPDSSTTTGIITLFRPGVIVSSKATTQMDITLNSNLKIEYKVSSANDLVDIIVQGYWDRL